MADFGDLWVITWSNTCLKMGLIHSVWDGTNREYTHTYLEALVATLLLESRPWLLLSDTTLPLLSEFSRCPTCVIFARCHADCVTPVDEVSITRVCMTANSTSQSFTVALDLSLAREVWNSEGDQKTSCAWFGTSMWTHKRTCTL